MQQAYLIGITNYPNHPLPGVPNDLALMQRALRHQGFAPEAIQTFGDEQGTLAGLHQVLATIREDFAPVVADVVADATDNGLHHCFFYFSGSGMLAVDPLQGGIKPLDGDDLNFQSALSFAELNRYLPMCPGIQVTVVLDC